MDKAFLEDDEEIDPTANVRTIKANIMTGGRRGRCVRCLFAFVCMCWGVLCALCLCV